MFSLKEELIALAFEHIAIYMKKLLLFENKSYMDRTIAVGQKRQVKADGKLICLIRTANSLIAFYDQCPHLGAALSAGHLNALNEVICPWHSFRFDLTSGEESNHRCSSLKFIEVSIEDNKTYLII